MRCGDNTRPIPATVDATITVATGKASGQRSSGAVDDMNAAQARQAHQQLVAHYNELAELAGSLAHEIRNPLSVIRMNMDLLAEDLAEAETPRERRARSKVDVVHDQCTRLENLLNDFLKFARVRKLDLVPGALNRVVDSVLRLYEAHAAEREVRMLPHLDRSLPSVMMDEEALRAAIMNLVKNALEAMEAGGVLTVITRGTSRGVAVDLIDTGKGIDESTARHMFDAFYSTKDGGSGLGLPTARKIVEAHGGRIQVRSELGQGTKFTLEFPMPRRL